MNGYALTSNVDGFGRFDGGLGGASGGSRPRVTVRSITHDEADVALDGVDLR